MKVIDVSKYNGSINWTKAAKGCDGVIIRAGYRGYGTGELVTDERFKENIKGALKAGIKVGVYFVTQAITEAEGKAEALYSMELVKGYNLELPIFIDSENGDPKGNGRADAKKLNSSKRSKILKAFCNEIEKNGYKAGVYASQSWFENQLDFATVSKFYKWVAKYSDYKPTIPYNAWQFTDKGKIDGINGNVDVSIFEDAQTEKEKTRKRKKSVKQIVQEVLLGKWGNGEERKARLEAAGYDYKAIQKAINEQVGTKTEEKPKEVIKEYYTVVRGDTLGAIAKKYNTTVVKLVGLNKISDPNKIYIGQRLRVK